MTDDKTKALVERLMSDKPFDDDGAISMFHAAAAELTRLDALLTARTEALGEMEQRATATLAAMDRYNEKNGTAIIGPSLLQLGKAVAHARATLNKEVTDYGWR